MKYSHVHKSLIINQKEIELLTDNIIHAMKKYRESLSIPLGKREKDGPLEDVDHAEKSIIEGLESIGIDLGVKWGSELDLEIF